MFWTGSFYLHSQKVPSVSMDAKCPPATSPSIISFARLLRLFSDVLSKIKDFKGNCTKKQDNMKKKEKYISVINELKNKIISIGILEYQRKVTELTKNIENEPIGKLEMITGQIKFDISMLRKKLEETKFLKKGFRSCSVRTCFPIFCLF